MANPEPSSPAAGAGGRRHLVIFIGLLTLVALTGFVASRLTHSSRPPMGPLDTTSSSTPRSTRDPAHVLEALHARLLTAYESRDVAQLRAITVPGSKAERNGLKDIRRLIRDDVQIRTSAETTHVEVLASSSNQLELRHEFVLSNRFVGRQPDSVDESSGGREIQRVEWIIKADALGDWRFFRGTLLSAETLDDR